VSRSVVAAFVCALLGSASIGAEPNQELFPRSPAIDVRVAFWKRVFTEVGTDGGLIHDRRQLDRVYEVIALPSGTPDAAARELAEKRRKQIEDALRSLAAGKRSGLSRDERKLLASFPPGVGDATLASAAENVRFQLGQADRFRAGLARQARWDAFIRRTLGDHGVPPELGALPHVESSFDPAARSKAGASGLWQFMPATGRRFLRVDRAVDARNDPYQATRAAAQLLKKNHQELGTWPLAITAYNHGTGGMLRAVEQLATRDITRILETYESPSFGFASRNFYAEFLAAAEIDREPERYFGPLERDAPEQLQFVTLDRPLGAAELARGLGLPLGELQRTNPAVSSEVWTGRRPLPKGYVLALEASHPEPHAKLARIAERPSGDAPGRHTVASGETLSEIAARYRVSADAIARRNGIVDRNRIRAGTVLAIPAPGAPALASAAPAASGARSYQVRRGDTLYAIARRAGVDVAALASANGIANHDEIRIGQLLALPD
jgi:membrane-bound lytic murein transglycosylase D